MTNTAVCYTLNKNKVVTAIENLLKKTQKIIKIDRYVVFYIIYKHCSKIDCTYMNLKFKNLYDFL